MARDCILDLFVAIAARPHTQCVRRRAYPATKYLRYASTSTTRPPSSASRPKEQLPTPDASRSTPRAIRVPLHVGLDRNPEQRSAISRIPIPKGEKGEKFTPSVLARPLGLEFPPRPGQNSPVDRRTWAEKKEDFTSYDKVMERRQIYLRSFLRPYFQEWRRVDHWKGKSFVSNERLFKRDKALYFPNIWGQTLSKSGDGADGGRDTTNAFLGKITIVGIQSGHWAEEQVDTYIGPKHNAELQGILKNNGTMIQRADINIQGDWLRSLLVKFFRNNLRKVIPEERWDRYFMVKLPRDVRRGLTEDVRDAMGLLNSQVGYVYLLDSSCKIRWAGSGHAWDGEVQGLNGALQRLLAEEQSLRQSASLSRSAAAPQTFVAADLEKSGSETLSAAA